MAKWSYDQKVKQQMTRAGFFTALGALIALPFTGKPETKPHMLPKDRMITPEDIEELVQKEVDRMVVRISGRGVIEGKDLML